MTAYRQLLVEAMQHARAGEEDTAIANDNFGGFSLDLSSGVRLTVFPSGSHGEQGRFFQPDAETGHFVVGTDAWSRSA